jgi:hypothetical protein
VEEEKFTFLFERQFEETAQDKNVSVCEQVDKPERYFGQRKFITREKTRNKNDTGQ